MIDREVGRAKPTLLILFIAVLVVAIQAKPYLRCPTLGTPNRRAAHSVDSTCLSTAASESRSRSEGIESQRS